MNIKAALKKPIEPKAVIMVHHDACALIRRKRECDCVPRAVDQQQFLKTMKAKGIANKRQQGNPERDSR